MEFALIVGLVLLALGLAISLINIAIKDNDKYSPTMRHIKFSKLHRKGDFSKINIDFDKHAGSNRARPNYRQGKGHSRSKNNDDASLYAAAVHASSSSGSHSSCSSSSSDSSSSSSCGGGSGGGGE